MKSWRVTGWTPQRHGETATKFVGCQHDDPEAVALRLTPSSMLGNGSEWAGGCSHPTAIGALDSHLPQAGV